MAAINKVEHVMNYDLKCFGFLSFVLRILNKYIYELRTLPPHISLKPIFWDFYIHPLLKIARNISIVYKGIQGI